MQFPVMEKNWLYINDGLTCSRRKSLLLHPLALSCHEYEQCPSIFEQGIAPVFYLPGWASGQLLYFAGIEKIRAVLSLFCH